MMLSWRRSVVERWMACGMCGLWGFECGLTMLLLLLLHVCIPPPTHTPLRPPYSRVHGVMLSWQRFVPISVGPNVL